MNLIPNTPLKGLMVVRLGGVDYTAKLSNKYHGIQWCATLKRILKDSFYDSSGSPIPRVRSFIFS